MNTYKVLNKQIYIIDRYSLVPIRFEDRYDILKWRNEQIFHLRQAKLLTKEDQDSYFETVIAKLFEQAQPNQILFSFLEDGVCIGYGGLVHINWVDKNAEVSFIIDTKLELKYFSVYWNIYLQLLKKVTFDDLKLHKTYVYAFDLRPHLYTMLEEAGYFFDSRLKEHCIYNNEYIDVVIYSLINK